jgi:hypothetical protein
MFLRLFPYQRVHTTGHSQRNQLLRLMDGSPEIIVVVRVFLV